MYDRGTSRTILGTFRFGFGQSKGQSGWVRVIAWPLGLSVSSSRALGEWMAMSGWLGCVNGSGGWMGRVSGWVGWVARVYQGRCE